MFLYRLQHVIKGGSLKACVLHQLTDPFYIRYLLCLDPDQIVGIFQCRVAGTASRTAGAAGRGLASHGRPLGITAVGGTPCSLCITGSGTAVGCRSGIAGICAVSCSAIGITVRSTVGAAVGITVRSTVGAAVGITVRSTVGSGTVIGTSGAISGTAS